MQASDVVLEPVERRMSDARFGVVVGGVALAAASVVITLVLLPRGFGVLLALLLAYPAIQLVRRAMAAHRASAPRLVIGPEALRAGDLRFAWRDVSDVSVGPSARVRDRRDRVKVRLNRLVPVRPTDAAIRAAGLELGDQYFDFAIPPLYEVGPSEIAARIEARRGALRRGPAAPPAAPAPAPPAEAASGGPAPRRRGSPPSGGGRARRRPPAAGRD